MFDELDPDDELELKLRDDMDRLTGTQCLRCERKLCGHEVVFAVFLGFKNTPPCLACSARSLGKSREELQRDLLNHLLWRDCYRRAWKLACQREETRAVELSECLATGYSASAEEQTSNEISPAASPTTTEMLHWGAGDMACGDLVLALRGKLKALAPGTVLRVRALDAAAPEDIPAWCRLTHHRLLRAEHPEYDIQRKEN